MIIIEMVCGLAKICIDGTKALIRLIFWIITARDCYHCKYREHEVTKDIHGNCKHCDYCAKNDHEKCYNTECHETITRKDFERKR